MSNRNFDASTITRRNANKTVAKSVLSNMSSPTPYFFQPQTSNTNTSMINQVYAGNSQYTVRGDTCVTVDPGCPCPFSSFSTSIAPPAPTPINPLGNALWAVYLNGSGTGTGYSVATDSNGNVYVTGRYSSNVVTKVTNWDSTSNTQTDSTIELPALPSTTPAVFLMKYNKNGIAQWATYLYGTGNTGNEGLSVTLDSNNDVYVTGYYSSPNSVTIWNANGNGQSNSGITLPLIGPTQAMFIVKYNTNGQAQWATYISGNEPITDTTGRSVIVDSQNALYVTGQYRQVTGSFQLMNASGASQTPSAITLPQVQLAAMFLVKYNTSGQVQWATYLDGQNIDLGNSLSSYIDGGTDYIYVTGKYGSTLSSIVVRNANQLPSGITMNSTTTDAVFLIKYDSNGQAQWATYMNGTGIESGLSVVCDTNAVYVSGVYNQSITPPSSPAIYSVLGNSQQLTSYTLQTTINSAGFLIKYDTSGQVLWCTYIDGTGFDQGSSVTLDTFGNVYMSGSFSSGGAITIKNADGFGQSDSPLVGLPSTLGTLNRGAFLIKYDTNGVAQWRTYLNVSGIANIGYSVATDSLNSLYMTGVYQSTTNPVPVWNADGTTTMDLLGLSSRDMFLIRYA